MKWILGLLLTLSLACVNEDDSLRTLQSAGYTNIQITGWKPFSCGKDDTYSTGFTAKNPAGVKVTGVVCCGLMFKSCTVRV